MGAGNLFCAAFAHEALPHGLISRYIVAYLWCTLGHANEAARRNHYSRANINIVKMVASERSQTEGVCSGSC